MLAAFGLGCLLIVFSASPAVAHAVLIAANPAPGDGVPAPPNDVVLRFSETLNLELSRISVLDAQGRDVASGPTVAVVGDEHAMRRSLGRLTTGRYRVA